MDGLPINLEVLEKRTEIPELIAELSYRDQNQAVEFIRLWSKRRITIDEIHKKLHEALKG